MILDEVNRHTYESIVSRRHQRFKDWCHEVRYSPNKRCTRKEYFFRDSSSYYGENFSVALEIGFYNPPCGRLFEFSKHLYELLGYVPYVLYHNGMVFLCIKDRIDLSKLKLFMENCEIYELE